ncbi:hypothetical protein VYU27_008433 [Nannochloropsis oceanica]
MTSKVLSTEKRKQTQSKGGKQAIIAARNQSKGATVANCAKRRERTNSSINSGSSKNGYSRAVLFTNEEEEGEEEEEEAEEEEEEEEEEVKEEEEEKEPDALVCPLSLELLSKAVCAADGHTYNQDVLQAWIDRCRNDRKPLTSPLSGKPMQSFFLPNQLVKTLVRDYTEAREKRENAKEGRGREGVSTNKWGKGKVWGSKKGKRQNTKENLKAPAKAEVQKQKK